MMGSIILSSVISSIIGYIFYYISSTRLDEIHKDIDLNSAMSNHDMALFLVRMCRADLIRLTLVINQTKVTEKIKRLDNIYFKALDKVLEEEKSFYKRNPRFHTKDVWRVNYKEYPYKQSDIDVLGHFYNERALELYEVYNKYIDLIHELRK